MRPYRAWRWWRALGRPQNHIRLPWRARLTVAWCWSSDRAAYEDAKPRAPAVARALVRPQVMALAIIAAHLLDILTFWMALAMYGVPISAEQNPWMASAFAAGGYLLVLASKAAFVSILLYLLSKVSEKPLWPPFLLAYGLGLVGTTANLLVIHGIW